MRAWFSIAMIPSPRISFWWMWFHSSSSSAPPSEKMLGVIINVLPSWPRSMNVSSRVF